MDIIVPLKTDLLAIAVKMTIPSIFLNLNYNKLYIITNSENFENLKLSFGNKVVLIDEDKVFEGLTFENVSNYLNTRIGSSWRTGWYFQQFLKFAISMKAELTSDYLVWDADAVALKPIAFYNKSNQIYVTKSEEYHQPYFNTVENLIGIQKQVKYSFISEHMVFTKKYVSNLLTEISEKSEKVWWEIILDNVNINYLAGSGFSEYELYGNYVMHINPMYFQERKLNKLRDGVKLLGNQPNTSLLMIFSYLFDYISFETYHKKIKSFLYRYFLIILIISSNILKQLIKKLTL